MTGSHIDAYHHSKDWRRAADSAMSAWPMRGGFYGQPAGPERFTSLRLLGLFLRRLAVAMLGLLYR